MKADEWRGHLKIDINKSAQDYKRKVDGVGWNAERGNLSNAKYTK